MLAPVYFAASLLALGGSPASVDRTKRIAHRTRVFTPTNYTVVPDLFIQDSPTFSPEGYNVLVDSFGLLDKSPSRWNNFTAHIDKLNAKADELTAYKVVFIARHGQGYHNAAETQYGTPAWNCKWSLLMTDGNITWGPDAKLTPTGVSQAELVNAAWKQELKAGVPLPQVLYSSPLSRSASTLSITWRDIRIDQGMKPIFKEGLRESIGLHTCDQRKSKSYLQNAYPDFTFETPFSEHDQLWDATYQESAAQEALRLQQQLNQIFATDPSTFISITAHSGIINAFFTAIEHHKFSVQTGGLVPVVIKAVGHPTATNVPLVGGQSQTAPVCTATARRIR